MGGGSAAWIRGLAGALIDDPHRFAGQRAGQGFAIQHMYLGGDTYQGFDTLLQLGADVQTRLVAGATGQLAAKFAPYRHVVEHACAADLNLVIAGKLGVAQYLLFNLAGKDVDTANDQHVVRAAGNLAHAPETARSWRL